MVPTPVHAICKHPSGSQSELLAVSDERRARALRWVAWSSLAVCDTNAHSVEAMEGFAGIQGVNVNLA